MTKYVVTDPKENTYLNNIHLDILGSRMVGVNMVEENCPSIIKFWDENDAQGVADRINKNAKLKKKVKVLEIHT